MSQAPTDLRILCDYERALQMYQFAPQSIEFCRLALAQWLQGSWAGMTTLLLDAGVGSHGYRFLIEGTRGALVSIVAVTPVCGLADLGSAERSWLELSGLPAGTRYRHARVDLTTGAAVMLYAREDIQALAGGPIRQGLVDPPADLDELTGLDPLGGLDAVGGGG